jgi:cytochrome c6
MKIIVATLTAVLFSAVLGAQFAIPEATAGTVDGKKGEELFNKHCAMCHPGGGNIVNPKKTLKQGALESRNIRNAADIVRIMRNPGQGMTKFNEKTIPEADAIQIGTYILKTFK